MNLYEASLNGIRACGSARKQEVGHHHYVIPFCSRVDSCTLHFTISNTTQQQSHKTAAKDEYRDQQVLHRQEIMAMSLAEQSAGTMDMPFICHHEFAFVWGTVVNQKLLDGPQNMLDPPWLNFAEIQTFTTGATSSTLDSQTLKTGKALPPGTSHGSPSQESLIIGVGGSFHLVALSGT
ncbi:hypothetical protein ARMGADRAFT_1030501 [Armillaria gallica]|uniref:Uncharacterized protein n=1 Tax=Armillaria gallica TaxID=47427 RepID=A0A2H3DG09_ARMGA|nr:hypothetical protein ARMGADRAFT_1030501 [Armillaria gallica]